MKITVIAIVYLLVTTVEVKRLQLQIQISHLPKPKHHVVSRYSSVSQKKQLAQAIDSWSPDHKVSLWELSGQFEGDILIHKIPRNGVVKKNEKWPRGIIPYLITSDFSNEEKAVIKKGMNLFVSETCVRFLPYNASKHVDYVMFVAKDPGCFSFVGHHDRGQVVNFQKKCLDHGTVVHELLHVLGFYHQHSASERDNFIKINWNNIRKGTENQFRKGHTTNFGEPYDYESVMHYSAHAFSKNDEATITPLKTGVNIGQRSGASVIDLNKVRKMYKCGINKKWKLRKKTQKKKRVKMNRH